MYPKMTAAEGIARQVSLESYSPMVGIEKPLEGGTKGVEVFFSWRMTPPKLLAEIPGKVKGGSINS